MPPSSSWGRLGVIHLPCAWEISTHDPGEILMMKPSHHMEVIADIGNEHL